MAERKSGTKKKHPTIKDNVWSRFDDDGYGIHNLKLPNQNKKKTSNKKKK